MNYKRHVVTGIAPGGFNGALLPLYHSQEEANALGEKMFILIYRDDGYPTMDGRDTKGLTLRSVLLNEKYKTASKDRPLSIPQNIDPRLLWWRGRPYMISRYIGPRWRIELWPLEVIISTAKSFDAAAGLQFDFHGSWVDVFKDWRHLCFEGIDNWPGYWPTMEVNWTPFEEEGTLYLVHYPHFQRILRVNETEVSSQDRAKTPMGIPAKVERVSESSWTAPQGWPLELRGSTPPTRLSDGTWLSTFHDHSLNHNYRTGFYRFESGKPWKVISASREPVYTNEDAGVDRPWRYNIPNVFPLSLQVEGDLVRMAGGIAGVLQFVDHFSLKEILAGMVRV